MAGRTKTPVALTLFGRLRPTRGFHRAVALVPSLVRLGINVRLLILALPARHRYRVYARDFKKLLADSPVRDRILFSQKRLKKKELLKLLALSDLLLLPYEAGEWRDNFSDAQKAAKPLITSDLKEMARLVRKTRAGIVVQNDRELLAAIVQCTSGSSRPL